VGYRYCVLSFNLRVHFACSFIKQYYEMMTKSPENLHKFYNENSYFLHSDLAHVSVRVALFDILAVLIRLLHL
jgi:hypothetical protein